MLPTSNQQTPDTPPVASLLGLLACLAVLAPSSAASQTLEVSIGAKGGLTGTGAKEVPEDTPVGDPEFYGLFGLGGAGGPNVEVKYNTIVGLETGLFFSGDSTEGTNDINGPSGEKIGEIVQSQSTQAVHVPLLLKLSPPFDKVRPVLGLGFEFVNQTSSTISYSGTDSEPNDSEDIEADAERVDDRNSVESAAYTLFQTTLGMEIDAGPVRIPIELRAGYNLSWNKSFGERVKVKNRGQADQKLVYDGEYLGHFGFYVGVLYRWDIAL